MKKLVVVLASVVALSIGVVVVVHTIHAEKIGKAELTLRPGASISAAVIAESFKATAGCAEFAVKSMETAADGKVLCEISGMGGSCCLEPAETALQRVEGVETVTVTLSSEKKANEGY